MTKNTHTPGPWKTSACITVRTADDRFLKICVAESGESRLHNSESYPTFEEAEANARLIAAAPDLLAACERSAAEMWNRGVHDQNAVYTQLRTAIAKARGEEVGK